MRIVMPFWYLDDMQRFVPQLEAISKHNQLTILYLDGNQEYIPNVEYKKVEKPFKIQRALDMFGLMEDIMNQIRDLDFDLVYSLTAHWYQLIAHRISVESGKPLVIRLRGDEKKESYANGKKWSYELVFKDLLLRTYEHARYIIPIASHLKEAEIFKTIPRSKFTDQVPNGIDQKKFNFTPRSATGKVGYIGRISKEKGSRFLEKVINYSQSIEYIVAGKIEDPIAMSSNVDYRGHVDYLKIQEVIKECDVIIITSDTEGLPNVLLESYSIGRPVIIRDLALPSQIKLFGKTVSTPERMVTDIAQYLAGFIPYNGFEASQYASQFTWEWYGMKMTDIFERAVKEHKK